ncbi:MAG: SDR family oxidoreductase [Myxococcales bacterium]|nr:SDR family oxidoreductase [Myxococcales bacterium]
MAASPRPRAVVTGASSGIGADIARELASRGFDLVLAARRQDRLLALADEIRNATRPDPVEVECVAVDLSVPDGPATLWERATARGGKVHALVNNAGFGAHTVFERTEWAKYDELLRLNVRALTELTWLAVRHMRGHGERAYVLQVASIGGHQPTAWFAVYAATKSYVCDFSAALGFELQGTNVSVTCLSPGATVTEFSDVAQVQLGFVGKLAMMASRPVARVGVRGMLAGRREVVPGFVNKLAVLLAKFLPRWLVVRSAARLMGRPS